MPDAQNPSSMGYSDPQAATGLTSGGADRSDFVNRAAAGAHEAVDRIADKAGPAMNKVESSVAQASELLQDKAQRIREMGDDWTHSVRDTVRENPLASLMVAVAVGALVARMSR